MNDKQVTYYKSPLGFIEIMGNENGITSLEFVRRRKTALKTSRCLNEYVKQLDEYFKGKRRKFSVKLNPEGTEFQMKVWKELLKIPCGKTVSYKYIAESIGNGKAQRAVGNANNKNKISIIIPCHRVIGSNGELTGYGGGLWRKKWLIGFEEQNNS